MNRRIVISFWILAALLILAVYLNLFYGVVTLPSSEVWAAIIGSNCNETTQFIVCNSRVPQIITAILSGASLAVSGLLLQTSFANPLADPGILGVNAGASLGVAIVMLLMGGSLSVGNMSLGGCAAILFAAFVGAALVLGMLVFFASVLSNNLMLLIVGLMVSYITSAVISLLNTFSTADGVHSYIFWGMGNFEGVSSSQLPIFGALLVVGLLASLALIKPMNALLLGERYAENLGFSIRWTRVILLLVTGVLTAVATAFCGPIAFLGLAVPHMARLMSGTANHRFLLPLTMLAGAVVASLSEWMCHVPSGNVLIPLNVITSLWGVPVILYVLFFKRVA